MSPLASVPLSPWSLYRHGASIAMEPGLKLQRAQWEKEGENTHSDETRAEETRTRTEHAHGRNTHADTHAGRRKNTRVDETCAWTCNARRHGASARTSVMVASVWPEPCTCMAAKNTKRHAPSHVACARTHL
eukprot:358261-Chlamydomonas_euryale.AAC.5